MKNDRLRTLTSEISVAAGINEVFTFFSKAENLDLITPPELKFKILTPLPVEITDGTLIDYSISLSGIPFKWKTKISRWEPPDYFIDVQLKGPYKIWIHEHIFRSQGTGTVVKDVINYLPPGSIAEPVINRLFVKKKLERVLEFRKFKINEIFNK